MDNSLEFQVQIVGLDQLVAAFNKAPEIVEPTLQNAIVKSQQLLAKWTRKGIVPWKTGNLVQTFRQEVDRLIAHWFPTAKYAEAVHEGTSPHDIFPTNKKALFWPGASHPVRVVHHPGSKGNRYMPRIMQNAQPEINDLFAEALRIIASDLAQK